MNHAAVTDVAGIPMGNRTRRSLPPPNSLRAHRDNTRALRRELFAAEANPIPDEREGTLTVALKTGTRAKPRLIFKLVSD